MRNKLLLLATGVCIGAAIVAAQQASSEKPKGQAGTGDQAKIQMAMTGAPTDISKNATIMDVDSTGHMTELRKGTNGWTCMPSAGGAAGAAGADPMCLDQTWMGWADGWMHKTDPQIKSFGVAYMLRGDKGASNTDPYATAATATNDWIVSPPHVMLLVPDQTLLDSLPTDPHTGGPWVMWKGTKYAHVMVPLSAVPAKK